MKRAPGRAATLPEQCYSPGSVNWAIDQFDVRPGGRSRMPMPSPEGEMLTEGTGHVVAAPCKLVPGPTDGSMPIHAGLEATPGGTHMVVAMEGLAADKHDIQEAWSAGFHKLEVPLASGRA